MKFSINDFFSKCDQIPFFVQRDALRCMTNFSASTKKEIKSLDEDEDRR